MLRTPEGEVKSFDPLTDATARALFKTEKAKKRMVTPFREGPLEILENHWSTDPRMLKLKAQIAEKGTAQFYEPGNPDEVGRVTGAGFRTNLQGLRYVPGFGQLPATWPMTDNRPAREAAGLVNEMPSGWKGNILRGLFRLMFTGLQPQPLKFRKGSSTMWPYYEKEVRFKQELARYVFEHAPAIGKLMAEGRFETAFNDYGFALISDAVYRNQSNDGVSDDGKTPKPRPIVDREYAISGGRRGRRYDSDRSFDKLEDPELRNLLKGFFRQRKRTAFGHSAFTNYTLAAVAQPVRAAMYKRWPKSLHHTTRDELQSHLSECFGVVAADVSQHDQMWPTFLMDVARDELLNMGYPEWWVAFFYYQAFAPVFVTGVGPNEPNSLLGDWRNPNVRVGLPSGNSFTDILGTWLMTSVYAMMLFEHISPRHIRNCETLEGAMRTVDQLLKWELDVCMKDKSDDALLMVRAKHLVPALDNMIEMMKDEANLTKVNDIMLVTFEDGHAFLGNLLLYPDDYDMSRILVVGNPVSYFVNQLAPEYGVQSSIRDRAATKRPYPGLAWGTYDEVYGSIPVYGEMKELIEREWREVYGESYSLMRDKMLARDQKKLQLDMQRIGGNMRYEDMSAIELEVLQDPEKLSWKFAESDVRDEIVDLNFRGLTLEETEPFFAQIVPKEHIDDSAT